MTSEGMIGLKPAGFSNLTRSRYQWRVGWRWLPLAFAAIAIAAQGLAADTARADSEAPFYQFRSRNIITYLEVGDRGIPVRLRGGLSTELTATKPYDQVMEFLERNKDVFRMEEPRTEWKLIRETVDKRANTRHLRLQQMYHGLEVDGSELTAHFTPDGYLHEMESDYLPGLSLPWNPIVSENLAKSIVTQAVASPDSLDLSRCRLIVFPWQGKYHLAWQIVANPGGEYFVDALLGDVIYSWSGMPDIPVLFRQRIREVIDTAPTPLPKPVGFPPVGSPHGPR